MSPTNSTTGCVTVRDINYCKNNLTQIYFDGKIRKSADCDLDHCSLLVSHWGYLPNKPGNWFFVILFFLILLAHIPLGIWKRTWGPLLGITIGCMFEAVGTIGRIMAADSPFAFNPFLIYIIFQTIGPAFLSAAIYLCLSRIVVVYGVENSRFKPATYSAIFMVSDLVCLILQGAGGAAATMAKDDAGKAKKGINVMIAGLAWQVASLTLFVVAAVDFWLSVRGKKRPAKYEALTSTRRWHGFLWSLAIATITIYIRSVYRVAELSEGFTGKIANLEAPYWIFEPVMISIACIVMTIWHPSYVFGNMWSATDGKPKKATIEHGYGHEKHLPRTPATPSFSSDSSQKHLSISLPNSNRSSVISDVSDISEKPRWYISHHPDCPHNHQHHHHDAHGDHQAHTSSRRNGSLSHRPVSHRAYNTNKNRYTTITLASHYSPSSVPVEGYHQPHVKTPLLQQFAPVTYLPTIQYPAERGYLNQHQTRHSAILHSPKTAPLVRGSSMMLKTPTWTSAHQRYDQNPTSAIPRTPRTQKHISEMYMHD